MEPHDNSGLESLPVKWRNIIQRVASGKEWAESARAEGYSPEYAKVIGGRMLKNPAVVNELESIRAAGRQAAVYSVTEAIREADAAADFAIRQRNPMSLVKARELKSKLAGLLVDKLVIASIDLAGALSQAETRVIQLNPACIQTPQAEVNKPQLGAPLAYTRSPGLPGNPFAE